MALGRWLGGHSNATSVSRMPGQNAAAS